MINNKRGQVTVFVIIGILIVAGVVLFFTLREDVSSSTEQVPAEVEPVKSYVQDCLDESIEKSVFHIAERGGYSEVPSDLRAEVFGVPYYIKGSKNVMVSKEKMEKEFSKSVEEDVLGCVGGFSELEGFSVKTGEISAKTEIKEDMIEVDLDYPLTIERGDSSYNMNSFNKGESYRLGKIHNAVSGYVEEQVEVGEGFCVSCFLEFSSDYDFGVNKIEISEGSKIFIISDHNTKINNETMIYGFAGDF